MRHWRVIAAGILLAIAVSASRGQSPIGGTALDVDVYGNAYILDADEATAKLVSPSGGVAAETGGPGWEDGRFDRPAGIWARNGIDVFVADYGNHRVQRFDRTLHFISSLSTRENENESERFGYPLGAALSALGDLFVIDGENTRIMKVNRLNKVERSFGGFDAGKGRLRAPKQIEIGGGERIYVLDPPRVLVYDYSGNYLRELLPGVFASPTAINANKDGVAVLDGSTLYACDQDEHLLAPVAIAAEWGVIRGIASSNGKIYLMAGEGMKTMTDPRGSADAH